MLTAAALALLVIAATQPAAAQQPTAAPSTSYQAFPSPQQEPGPSSGETTTAIGLLEFDPYLTQVQVTFYLKNLNPSQIAAFHLHCGLPGQLGPIVVNFNIFGSFTQTFSQVDSNTYLFSQTVTDADVDEANWPPSSLRPPPACAANNIGPAPATNIAGIEALARIGQLYFNVHVGNSIRQPTYFFGLIRGQVYSVETPINAALPGVM